MTGPVFRAKRIGLGYHKGEDRLVLLLFSDDQERQLYLTRRICTGLLDALGGLLERSAAAGEDLPEDLREAVVFMEHQRSIFDPPKPGGEGSSKGKAALDEQGVKLATAVNIKSSTSVFNLLFSSRNEQVGLLKLGRRELHRLVNGIKTQAENAHWNLDIKPAWLGLGDEGVTID